jgi:hypothetical protein
MFKGYRDGKFAIGLILGVSIATLCFLWVFSISYCPDAPCNYQQSPDQSGTYSQRWFPIPWIPNSTLQPQPEFTEGAPKQYEYYDLQAQENMARATNIIAWATVVTVFTSIFGVWLLVSNLKVVAETNTIMRDDQRPWVQIDSLKIRELGPRRQFRIDETDPSGITGTIKFSLKNTGKMPAQNVSVSIEMSDIDDAFAKVGEVIDDNVIGIGNQIGVIAPNSVVKDREFACRPFEGPNPTMETEFSICISVVILYHDKFPSGNRFYTSQVYAVECMSGEDKSPILTLQKIATAGSDISTLPMPGGKMT